MIPARTGTGKTRNCAIPALPEYSSPTVVIDVKGELYDTTATCRAGMRHQIVRIDPWKVCGSCTDGFNPLDKLLLIGVDRDDAAAVVLSTGRGSGRQLGVNQAFLGR